MKTWVILGISIWALLASAISGQAQTINTASTNASAPPQFSIVQRSENQRVWQRTINEVLPSGQTVSHLQTMTEVANGICYPGAGAGGQWLDSQELISILPDGSAAATNGIFQLFCPPDIYEGAMQLKSGDVSLSSQPQYLTYSDGTNYAIIAELTNSVGELISSNQLLYPGAFSGPGVDADLMMTYRRSGVEQDVIFRTNPPAPEQFGLSSSTARLQLLTEFFNVPAPQATVEPVDPQSELQDSTLTFGGIRMIQGRAFLIGNAGDPQVPIYKNWQSIDANTSVLVEQLPYSQVAASLATLPARVSSKKSIHSPLRKVASRWDMPSAKRTRTSTNTVKMVRIKQRPGFTLDYITINNNQSLTNFVFTGDNLFYVSGPAYLYGTTVLEGGSVIKANTNGVINIMAGGTVDCQTQPYLPAIFTSYNDNAVAYGIGSGSPAMGDVNTFLNLNSTNVVLHDLHFAYALNAVNQTGAGSTASINLWDSEFVDVATAVNAYNIGLYNVLIGRTALTNAAVIVDGVGSLVGENVTADYGNEFIQATNSGTTIALTNCLVTRQPLLITGSTATLLTNAVVCLTNLLTPVYQACGGGGYYLTNSSPYATNGTPNIDPDLLGDLQQKTVWPPLVYADTNISSLGTLTPFVARDTNTYPAIGFNYDPLDVVFGGADLHSNLTVTTGTAIGWFEETGTVSVSGEPYSMTLNNGANLTFNGTATQPCYWSQYAMVQERGNNNWNGAGYMGSFTFNGSSGSQEPLLTANFTKFTMGNLMILLRDNSALGAGSFKNCEIDNATIGTFDMQYLTFTNCLFFRDSTVVYNSSYTLNLTNDNCTYYNGGLGLARVTGQNSYWSIENTIFDGTQLAFYDEYNGATNQTFFEYNAFNTNNLSWETYSFPYSNWTLTNTLEDLGSSDLLTSNFQWESSWFGDFYLPTNSSVIRMGSTNANFLGLYHFTTQTNQIAEGTNRVTIGYAYVATDKYGNPLDSNGDGIPDYLEDANGDGLVDNGETNWALAILTQPVSQIAVPGTNANFYVGADGVAPLSYQWYFNGTNIVWGTNATLVITNAQSTNEGLYFAVVSNFSGSLTSSVVALEPFGLVGWWPGESNALDNAGPNNGNLYGTSFTNGIIGQAFQFDGTNGYILVPDSPILKPTNLTVEAWVRFSSLASQEYLGDGFGYATNAQIIIEKPDINQPTPDNGFYNDGYVLFKQADGTNDNFVFGVTKSDGETEDYATNLTLSIQTNVWYFVAGVRGSNYIQIYVNGQLSGQTEVDFDQSYGAAPLYFGSLGEPALFDARLEGSLDEVSLYNRALSSNEIQATYSAELSGIRNCLVPPVIVTQPASQSVTEGTTATLLVAAAGSPPLSYQWSFDGTNIAGATNATLLLPGVQGTNTGNYSVVVSNNRGTLTSSNATLVVDTCFPAVDVTMVIDASCYMDNLLDDGTMKLTDAQIAATNFVRALNFTNDQAALYSFNDNVTTNQVLTDNLPDLLNAIGSLTNIFLSHTVMGNALQISQSELASPRHNPGALPVMVFLSGTPPTDINQGNDFTDTSNLVLEAATLVKAAGIRLITVTLTNADTNLMEFMASSPGDAYYATNLIQLTNDFNLIADSICRGTNTPPSDTLSVQITAPGNNQTFNAGSNITISATASNSLPTAPVWYVEFFVGTNAIGIDSHTNALTNILYQTYWVPLDAGTNVLRAYAVATNGSETWTAWSQPVTNFINGLPEVTITTPANGANLGSTPASTTITTVVVPAGAAITNVSVFTNGVFIGTNLSLTLSTLAAGVYTLTATATDTNGATGVSSNIVVTVDPPNQRPFVYAGPNQVTNLPSALLTGFVSDDGLPSNYLAATWSLVSGPSGETVMFVNSNQPQTTVTFSITGTNVLQLTATDGSLTNTGQVKIIVVQTNALPLVNAGPDRVLLFPALNSTNPFEFEEAPLTYLATIDDGDAYAVPSAIDYFEPSNDIVAIGGSIAPDYSDDLMAYLIGTNAYATLFEDLGPEFPYTPEPLVTARGTSGGFTAGEVFCGSSAPGEILRIEPDGSMPSDTNSSAWVLLKNSTTDETTAGELGYIAAICKDQTGTWDSNLLAMTVGGDVWEVDSSGQASELAAEIGLEDDGGSFELNLMTTVPNNVREYGPLAGRLIILNHGPWLTLDTNGFVVNYASFPYTYSDSEAFLSAVAVIPQGENLYGCGQGNPLWSIPAGQFQNMAGDLIVAIYPFDGTVNNPSLLKIHWNGTSLDVAPDGQSTYLQNYDTSAMTFCPAGVQNTLPASSRIQLQGAVHDAEPTTNMWYEISGPFGGSVAFDDPEQTNTFADFSEPGIYTLRLTASDPNFTSYDDVQITVLSSELTVSAGTNQILATTNTVLPGIVTDTIGTSNQVTLTWSVISSPAGGGVDFGWTNETTNTFNSFTVNATNSASFSKPGIYLLQLTANDGISVVSSNVTVAVQSPYLMLTPNYGWPSLTNTPFTVTANLVDSNNVPIVNTNIQFYVVGASGLYGDGYGPSWSTNTDVNGNASFTYSGTNQGRDEVIAMTTVGSQSVSNMIYKDWAIAFGCDSELTNGIENNNSEQTAYENFFDSYYGGPGDFGWWPESVSIDVPVNTNTINYADYYILNGLTNSTVTISCENFDFPYQDLALVLRDPSNNIVATSSGATASDALATNDSSLFTYTFRSSGSYLLEVINLFSAPTPAQSKNESSESVLYSYALGLSCDGDTNDIVGGSPSPQLQVIYNGTNLASGGTITFPPSTNLEDATTVTLLLTNVGLGSFQFSINAAQTDGNFSLTNNLSSVTIPPGGSTNLGVVFDASSNGPAIGQLVLFGNFPVSGNYQAYLSAGVFSTGPPPAIIITSPRNLTSYYAPAFIPITAAISPGVTNVVSVTFEAATTNGIISLGTILLGTNTSCSTTWNYVPNGNYLITAVATDAAGRTTTSPAISITVYPINDAAPPPVTANTNFIVLINSVNNVVNPLPIDHDPESNVLSITGINVPPVNGTAAIIDNGQALSYTPNAGFYSETADGILQPFDGLSCQISNGKGGSAFQAVTFFVYPEKPPVPVVAAYPGGYSYSAGSTVSFIATITNIPATNIANVNFYIDGNFIGQVTNGTSGVYTLNWTNVFIVSSLETVTAVATDILGEQGTSGPLQIDVTTPSADLIGVLDHVTGTYGNTPLALGNNGSLPVIRDGVFQVWGNATNTIPATAVTWTLGVYSSDGSTFLCDLTPATTSSIGTANSSGVLVSNCDLTMLQNGVYDFRLEVIGGGQAQEVDQNFILESNLKIGEFSFSQQDLVIPVNGIPLTVTRTYNSLNSDKGDFGYGWTYTLSDMDVTLDETRTEQPDIDGHTFSVRTGGGRDITLTLPNGQRTTFYYYPTYTPDVIEYIPEWKTAPGQPASLGLVAGPNSAQVEDYWEAIYESDGGEPYWEDLYNDSDVPDEVYDFPSFTLMTPDGTKYILDRPDLGKHTMSGGASGDGYEDHAWGTPYLAKIEEPNGSSTITINSNGIVYASGTVTNQITFQRNSLGLISSISDPNSIVSGGPPAVKYEYDASGNLIYVERLANRSPASYVTNYFFYTNSTDSHYITSVLNGDGTQVAQNYYDSSGKLIETVDASGNTTYFNNNLTNNSEAVVDRLGNTNTYVYDTRGNVIVQTDALNETTTNSYDSNNNLLSATDPLNNTTRYAYDGNNNRTMMVDALGHTNRYGFDQNSDLISQTDPMGDTTSNLYDGFGDLFETEQFDTNGNLVTSTSYAYQNFQLSQTFNANGQLVSSNNYDSSSGYMTSTTDANGLTRNFGYDADGNQTNSSYLSAPPGGGTAILVTNETFYDGQNRGIMTIDQYGDTNQTFYDLNGKVTYTIDKFGNTNSFVYDARGNQIQAIDAKGNVTYAVFDLDSRPILTTDPNGITGSLTQYDAVGRVTNEVRLENVEVNIIPDSNAPGQMTSQIVSQGTGLSTNSTTYFANGWVKSRTSPDGTTTYGYYADGQTESVTDPLTNTTSYAYDAAGRQSQVQDALSHTTQSEYDALGRQIKTIFDNGTSFSNEFNNVGQKVGTVDQAGLLTQYGYDVAGALTNVIKPQVPGSSLPPTWSYQYDQYGRLAVTTDPNGHCTTNFYDALGNQVAQALPMGQVNIASTNNAEGLLWKQYDFMGQMIEHRYDNFGRETNKYYFASGATSPSYAVSYAYNQLDQLTNVTQFYGTNASSGYVALAYNELNSPRLPMTARMIASVNRYPSVYGGATALLTACMAIVVVSREKRRFLALSFRAEVARLKCVMRRPHRQIRLRMPSIFWRIVSPIALLAVILSEPGYYQLCTAQAQCNIPYNFSTPSARVTNFTYDIEGNLTQVNSPEGVINYSYDMATGRLLDTCTKNSEEQFNYDALGRLHSVTVAKRNGMAVTGETTIYKYDVVGNRSELDLPNGVVTTYKYDDLNRLTNMVHQFGVTNLATYSYMLNATGRRTNALEVLRQEDNSYQTNALTWQLDAMYRLTNEMNVTIYSGGTYAYTNAYTYDPAGNRLQKARTGSVAGTESYAYNADDEMTSVTGGGTTNYNYDANGSLTNAATGGATISSYTYDLANKLNGIFSAGGSQQAAYYYNDDGIRVESIGVGTTNNFLIDANNQTGYAQVLEELPALGATPTMSYVVGDDVLAQSTGPSTPIVNYFLKDGHGNNRQLIGLNALMSNHYDYEAYGSIQSSISSSGESGAATTKLYCGEQYDSVLQMYNLRTRYLDPTTGRFNQRDTFGGNNDDPQSLHKYLYGNTDPIDRVDPTGQLSVLTILLTIVFLIVIFSVVFEGKYEIYNHYGGSSPTSSEETVLKSARDFISSNRPPVPNRVVDAALSAGIRVHQSLTLGGNDAWGLTERYGQIGQKVIHLSSDSFALDKRLMASLLIHEATHTFQWSLRTYPGEHEAYQNQSDAIRSWGLAGSEKSIIAKIPGVTNSGFIDDVTWGFDTYNVNNPAWTD